MANWLGNFSYNGGGGVTPQQNLQNAKGISDKVYGGSSFVGRNGQWQELDMWGNPVGQAPAQQNPAQNSGAPQDPNKTADPTVQEPPQKKYGGVTGGYGSGDPVEVVPPEKKDEVAGSGVTPDGGPAKPPFEPITIAAGKSYSPRKGGGRGQIVDRFGGMQLTQEMLAGVPDTDIAKIREAAAKGPGAFKEFMKMNASAPWYAALTKSISEQMQNSGGFRKRDGSGGGGPVNMAFGPGNQRNMQDYAPAWMQKRRAENEAKNNPQTSTMQLYPQGRPFNPDEGMQFIDQNKDGVDDRTQGLAPPNAQPQMPPWMQFLQTQQQGGPQQNPPFDPRILQMLMGGR